MLVVHAEFPVDPAKRDEALELFRDLADKSRSEPGVIEYQVAADVDDPNLFRFTEQYEDEAAFGAHAESDHFEAVEAALPDLLDGDPEVIRFDVGSVAEVDL